MTAGLAGAALRQLLLAVAFVALLGTGTLDALTRVAAGATALSAAPGGGVSGIGRPAGLPARTEAPALPGMLSVRTPPLTSAPAPLGSTDGPPLHSGPQSAPPLTSTPSVAPSGSLPAGGPAGAPGSRAPPALRGTDASLPARP